MNKKQALLRMIRDGYYKLAYYSALSALSSRIRNIKLYKHFSKKRFECCKQILCKLISDYCNLEENEKADDSDLKDVVWTMWYQGYDNAPQIVKNAINSKFKHSNGHKVIVIDKENVEKYIEIPKFIKKKVEQGNISLAHFSDFVRCELLRKYGGVWIDSTIFVVDTIPDYIFEQQFWSMHWKENREWVASCDKWSVGVMASRPHASILEFCANWELVYWEKMDYPITYLLLDMFIAIFYEKNKEFQLLIDSMEYNNTYIFNFVEDNATNGNRLFDENEYEYMRKDTWLFQFTYKEKYVNEIDGNKTFFGKINQEGQRRTL